MAAEQYVNYLKSVINYVFSEYTRLQDFSNNQHELINKFLYDREFTLQYIRGAWSQKQISPQLANDIADFYLELFHSDIFPKSQETIDRLKNQNNQSRNPEFTGSPVNFSAQLVPPQQQSSIPPLPTNNGQMKQGGITPDQYAMALQNGQVLQARSAALQDPTGLYAALLSA